MSTSFKGVVGVAVALGSCVPYGSSGGFRSSGGFGSCSGLGSCGGSLAVVVAFRCSSDDGSTDLRLYTSTKLKIVNC